VAPELDRKVNDATHWQASLGRGAHFVQKAQIRVLVGYTAIVLVGRCLALCYRRLKHRWSYVEELGQASK
jgi:hypothetical protein